MFLITVLLVLAIIFGFALMSGGFGVGIPNRLGAYKSQFAQIDGPLKRRHEDRAVPNVSLN